MNYSLLLAKVEESTPWPLVTSLAAADAQEDHLPPVAPAHAARAAAGFKKALAQAEQIAKYGPTVQSLTAPCPARWPGTHAARETTPDVVVFETKIGPLARAYREQGRAHLVMYLLRGICICI